ncbi:MAG: DMT family transporter, partial [Jatrophihabitans sp.]|uniref:DMT family transporter n=1 Tax=Jatrophihabitans sp. TaxID=1932789 RepID=UPI003F81AB84
GAVTLLLLSAAGRRRLPPAGAVWVHLGVIAVLWCVVPFLLFAWAERHVSSGLASIYNATTPLMTILAALVALPAERLTPARLGGLLTGFVGVLVVLGPWQGLGGGDALAQLGLLAATACYGTAFVWFRRFVAPHGLPAVTVATVQVGLAAAMLLVISPWVASAPVHLSWKVVGSVLALGMFGTGLAYLWNTNVINAWGATNASTVTYLTPVVGVALGAIVLDEGVRWNEPVGAALVIVGIGVGQGRVRLPARARAQVRA